MAEKGQKVMFSKNNRISERQIKRIIVVACTGTFSITVVTASLKCAGTGALLSQILMLIMILLVTRFIFSSSKMNKKSNQITSIDYACRIISITRIILLSIIIIYISGITINKMLLQEVRAEYIVIILIAASIYSAIKGIEPIARMCEVLYIPVILFVLYIIVTGVINGDMSNIFPIITLEGASIWKIIITALIMTILTPIEILTYSRRNTEWSDDDKKVIYFGEIIVGIVSLLITAAIISVSKIEIVLLRDIPLLELSEISGICIGIIITVGICTTIAAFLYYIAHLTSEKIGAKKEKIIYGITSIVMAVIIIIVCNSQTIDNVRVDNQNVKPLESIEERAFVMAVGISKNLSASNKKEDNISMTLAFPNLAELTGQQVPDDYSSVYTLTGSSIEEITTDFQKMYDKYVDFSHTAVWVFDTNAIEDKAITNEVIRYVMKDSSVTKRIPVCITSYPAQDLLMLDNKVIGSIGTYISKVIANNSTQNVLLSNLIEEISIYGNSSANGNEYPFITITDNLPSYYSNIELRNVKNLNLKVTESSS